MLDIARDSVFQNLQPLRPRFIHRDPWPSNHSTCTICFYSHFFSFGASFRFWVAEDRERATTCNAAATWNTFFAVAMSRVCLSLLAGDTTGVLYTTSARYFHPKKKALYPLATFLLILFLSSIRVPLARLRSRSFFRKDKMGVVPSTLLQGTSCGWSIIWNKGNRREGRPR